MSPASKSKLKASMKSVKEQQQKASLKMLTAPVNGGNSVAGGAYNPISGTFYSLERASSAPSPAPQSNGRFQTIDEREEHSGSSNGTPEYDSVSNGSCSGESEDQKEKAVAATIPRREAIPGCDTDKRDKNRQKNEKKHQRQRERRAQELHERCNGFLVSRKLESLAQQLVAMGFSSEQATTALIQNEGQVEESVAWLLEGGEAEQCNVANSDTGNNLKIDISDELCKMADMEVEFKCTKQEVERAIVACEGDMEKAADVFKAQRQEPPVAPSKAGGSGELSTATGAHKMAIPSQNTIARTQVKVVNTAITQQRGGDELDYNYSKTVLTGAVSLGSRGRNLQPPRLPPKAELSRLQVSTATEKRWPGAASNPAVSVSYSASSPSPVGAPPTKVEARFAVVGSEVKTTLLTGSLREPVVVMQRPQSSAKQNLPSTSVGLVTSPAVTSGWYPTGVSNVETVKASVGGLHGNLQSMSSTTSNTYSAGQHHMSQYQSPMCSPVDTATSGWVAGSTWSAAGMPTGMPSSLAVPSSLGLFTGWGSSGSSGSSSPVDWSTGSAMMQCDYASIDWSLDSTPLRTSKTDRDWLYDAWATKLATANFARPGRNGAVRMTMQDRGLAMDPMPALGSHEWTSPFAGKDIFSLPRRFVTSPSM